MGRTGYSGQYNKRMEPDDRVLKIGQKWNLREEDVLKLLVPPPVRDWDPSMRTRLNCLFDRIGFHLYKRDLWLKFREMQRYNVRFTFHRPN